MGPGQCDALVIWGWNGDIRKTDTDWTPRSPPLAQGNVRSTHSGLCLGRAVAGDIGVSGAFQRTRLSRSPKRFLGVTVLQVGTDGLKEALGAAPRSRTAAAQHPDTETLLNAEP